MEWAVLCPSFSACHCRAWVKDRLGSVVYLSVWLSYNVQLAARTPSRCAQCFPGLLGLVRISWELHGLCSSHLKLMGPSGTLCLVLLAPLKILLTIMTSFKAKLSLGPEMQDWGNTMASFLLVVTGESCCGHRFHCDSSEETKSEMHSGHHQD